MQYKGTFYVVVDDEDPVDLEELKEILEHCVMLDLDGDEMGPVQAVSLEYDTLEEDK